MRVLFILFCLFVCLGFFANSSVITVYTTMKLDQKFLPPGTSGAEYKVEITSNVNNDNVE